MTKYYTVAGRRWKAVPSPHRGSCIGCGMYHPGPDGAHDSRPRRDCNGCCKSKEYFDNYHYIFVPVEPEDEEISI